VLFQHGDTTWLFYSENSPKCLRASVPDGPHPLPKRWIIGGTIYARTRTRTVGTAGSDSAASVGGGGGPDSTAWSKPHVVYSQRQENTIPKLIANKLTAGAYTRSHFRLTSAYLAPFRST